MTFRLQAFVTAVSVSLFVLALGILPTVHASQLGDEATSLGANKNAAVTPESMAYLAQNVSEPEQSRVQALRFLSQYPNQNSLVAVARGLKDNSSIIREAAIEGAVPYPLEHRYRMVSPLLEDDVESVRIAATVHLLKDFEQLQMGQQAVLRTQSDKLITLLSAKKSYSQQLLLADIYRWSLRHNDAQVIYQKLLTSADKTAGLFLSLSSNYYAQGKDEKALNALDEGLALDENNASLHYSRALTLVRLKQQNIAAKSMSKAAELAPENAYYWYLNGVLQEPLDINVSIKSFEQAYLISGSPENLYAMCDIYIRNDHQNTEKCISALTEIAPASVINDLRNKQSL